ncbi:MAG: asparagine synthase (glutamine-hydrolyzing) [Desulfobacteraceae bacterium]|nr:MAG: asparagine synthase (glutamine-hydrolyzing) [Desulfobacteraceae bacterium]
MCGICGKVDFEAKTVNAEGIRKMCRTILYRGPDDEGIYASPMAGLGHRRLSIIDLSADGHEPMSNEDNTLRMVYNGELYDFQELREQVLAKGHILKSHTDCEPILHLYEAEGPACLQRLKGMFAFALWDERRQKLFLARDRLGIKPLYYYWDGVRLVFASEIKAVLADPGVPRRIDTEALDLYLTLNYIPAPRTIFKDLYKLPAGSYLECEQRKIKVTSYWNLAENKTKLPAYMSFEEQKKTLRRLLEETVQNHMIADVPLGAFLSGGLDSSIIVALMARASSRPVKTFSIGFPDLPAFDETEYARQVAELNQTEHYPFRLTCKDILAAFPAVLESLDEPFADSSAVPTYIVARETRKHVTVALSGDGGDELFAGYRMYLGEYWWRYYSLIPAWMRNHLLHPLIRSLPDARDKPSLEKIRRIKKFVHGMSPDFAERFSGWREIFPFDLRQKLLHKPFDRNLYLEQNQATLALIAGHFEKENINLMLAMDSQGLLPGDMLNKVDRMSMLNSLEVRVPFLDHRVVEYAFGLPGSTKLKARQGKYILRETFKDLLPPALHHRPKAGFEMPIGAWLRKELHFLMDEYLGPHSIRRQGLFDADIVQNLVQTHLSGRRDTSWQLWNLIVFQHWFKKYMG